MKGTARKQDLSSESQTTKSGSAGPSDYGSSNLAKINHSVVKNIRASHRSLQSRRVTFSRGRQAESSYPEAFSHRIHVIREAGNYKDIFGARSCLITRQIIFSSHSQINRGKRISRLIFKNSRSRHTRVVRIRGRQDHRTDIIRRAGNYEDILRHKVA